MRDPYANAGRTGIVIGHSPVDASIARRLRDGRQSCWLPYGVAVSNRTCLRCHRPVDVEADNYEVYERMHYVCFHYEYEHDPVDVDEECGAGGCPSRSVHPRPNRRPPAGRTDTPA